MCTIRYKVKFEISHQGIRVEVFGVYRIKPIGSSSGSDPQVPVYKIVLHWDCLWSSLPLPSVSSVPQLSHGSSLKLQWTHPVTPCLRDPWRPSVTSVVRNLLGWVRPLLTTDSCPCLRLTQTMLRPLYLNSGKYNSSTFSYLRLR